MLPDKSAFNQELSFSADRNYLLIFMVFDKSC